MKPPRLFLLLAPSAVMAGSSANYTLTPDTTDSGGLRGASTAYSVNTSTTAGGAGASATCTARTGFTGQLTDATALTVTASPLTITEGGTRQLSAALVNDDTSTTVLPANSVAWSVLSGPVTGISSGGLATAALVYQDTPASARGIHAGLTGTLNLTVLDTIADNYGAYAGDGLGDAWQVQYFGIGSANAAPLLDPDHDGWINLFEYNAGLVPTDPQSVFNFREETVPGQPDQRRIIFSPRLPGSTYTVMTSTTAAPGSWQPLTGAIAADNGTERTVTDTSATGPRKFYHIQVQKP